MVEIMKIMVTSFKRSQACTATLSAPNHAAGHHWPTSPLETPGHSQASLGQSLVESLFLSPGSWYIRFYLYPPRVCFPVLCKFWQFYGGVNGDFLQEGLCHTHLLHPAIPKSPVPRAPAPVAVPADPYLHRRCSNTVLSQSLWGPWVLVCTRFVWALWESLAGMQFDSKC